MTESGANPDHDRTVAHSDPQTSETEFGDEVTGVPPKIGNYRIKQVIASGGMGTVYLAVQDHPRRTVALKVMKRGIVSKSTLRRFEFESLILGRLRHPNIAQVYEAGTYDDGNGAVPFFAMEYIPKARPVHEYVLSKRLPHREVLEIFVQICDAVHHGHQKGVIHRDLKPANILVDASGEPKVIDFGVARATGSDMAVTTMQTDVGQIIGTLQYMSPEQCEADPADLDTRSDVYALGVVLYELLCGRLPYDVGQRPIYEAARMIRETNPARPSTINRTLRGDLETITMKALEKDRDRRYESAQALARDIERYLNDEPIDARPPSMGYQVRMFARRHRGAFAAMTAIAFTLVAATVISVVFAVRAHSASIDAANAETEAIKQRDLAVAALSDADDARRESEEQRDAALAAEAQAREQAYLVNIVAVADAISAGEYETAHRRLDRAVEAYRGWEFGHFNALVNQHLGIIEGHAETVNDIAFSSDGLRTVSGDSLGRVMVSSVAGTEAPMMLRGHDSPVYSVACSPTAPIAATSSADTTVYLWNLLTGQQLATLSGHTGVITSITFSRDGTRLVSAATDGSIHVWNPATAETETLVQLDRATADCVAFSQDGRRIVGGCDDETIRIWDASTGEELNSFEVGLGFINAIDFDPLGRTIVAALEQPEVVILDPTNGEEVRRLTGHTGFVTGAAYSPDGTRILTTSEDGTARLWDAGTGAAVAVFSGHVGAVTGGAFSPDAMRFATGGEDRTIRVWDAATVELLDPLGQPRSIAMDRNGSRLIVGTEDGSVELIDLVLGRTIGRVPAHDGAVVAVAVSPDRSLFATASDDHTVRVFDAATGQHRATLDGHERIVTSVLFLPDSTEVVTGSWDGTIRTWSIAEARETGRVEIEGSSVNCLALLSGAREVVAGLTDGEVHVFDLLSSASAGRYQGHEGPVMSLAADPVTDEIASASTDGTVRLWSRDRDDAIHVLRGHRAGVRLAVFVPGGDRLLSCSSDGTVRIWSRKSGEEVASLPWTRGPAELLAVSGDGRRVVVGSPGSIRLFDAAPRGTQFSERVDARLAQGTSRMLVRQHLDSGRSPDEIVRLIENDSALGPAMKRCALDALCEHCCSQSAQQNE